jgi:hypothetical protein
LPPFDGRVSRNHVGFVEHCGHLQQQYKQIIYLLQK